MHFLCHHHQNKTNAESIANEMMPIYLQWRKDHPHDMKASVASFASVSEAHASPSNTAETAEETELERLERLGIRDRTLLYNAECELDRNKETMARLQKQIEEQQEKLEDQRSTILVWENDYYKVCQENHQLRREARH